MCNLSKISAPIHSQVWKEWERLQVISMPQVNLQWYRSAIGRVLAEQDTYCKPIRLKVNRAIRMDSVEPLIDGVPAHDAA